MTKRRSFQVPIVLPGQGVFVERTQQHSQPIVALQVSEACRERSSDDGVQQVVSQAGQQIPGISQVKQQREQTPRRHLIYPGVCYAAR
jgi:hypothetical protein